MPRLSISASILVALTSVGGGASAGFSDRLAAVQPPSAHWAKIELQGVEGRIRTLAGDPVANARVTLFTPNLTTFAETRTGPDGIYRFRTGAFEGRRLGVAARGLAYQEVPIDATDGSARQDFRLAPETLPGRWDVIGTTAPETFDATDIGILLADGRVMFCHDTIDPVLFNPVTGISTVGASSGSPQGCMNTTLLGDGRVIMVGGQSPVEPGSFRNAIRWVKAYNPATNTWVPLPWLNNPTGRWYPGMARLNDGSLLAMGGGTAPNAARTATCERLNLSTMQWSYTGMMASPSEFTPTALLFSGEVLLTWSPPQLYNPGTGQFRTTGAFVQPDRGYPNHSDHSLVILADGRAAVIGVKRGTSGQNAAMAELYSPVTGTWSAPPSPTLRRSRPEVAQLPDGRVVVFAGDTDGDNVALPNVRGVVKWTDLYEPATGAWRRVADMGQFREYHAVTLLIPDGRVITTGGTVIDFGNPPTSADIEAFSPPYLFRGVRPQITFLSNATPDRGSIVSTTVFPQTRITSAVLMGMSAVTHWVDAGVPRRLVLPVGQSGTAVSMVFPTDPNVLPSGHYMLFLMVDDIPSVGRILRVP